MNPYATLPAGFMTAYWVIMGALIVLMLISWWKIFVKMGQPGWKGIIPIYNTWVLVGCLRKPKSWFWILLLGGVAVGILSGIVSAQTAAQMAAGTYMSGALIWIGLLMFALVIVLLVYQIKLYHALSKAFGHGVGFTIGLILLSIIFFPILAFGPSKFLLRE